MLLKSTTESKYDSVNKQLDSFIEATPDRNFFKSSESCWNDRRDFIFHAFASANGLKMTQIEVVHSECTNKG